MVRQGIRPTVENVGFPLKNSVLFDQAEFEALFDQLPPEVGCLLDTGHALLNHWDIPALIRRLGSRIWGYHLNNNDGLHDSHYPIYDPDGVCPPQEMDEILRSIAKYSPQADLVLEYAPSPRVTIESFAPGLSKSGRHGMTAGGDPAKRVCCKIGSQRPRGKGSFSDLLPPRLFVRAAILRKLQGIWT